MPKMFNAFAMNSPARNVTTRCRGCGLTIFPQRGSFKVLLCSMCFASSDCLSEKMLEKAYQTPRTDQTFRILLSKHVHAMISHLEVAVEVLCLL